jgi:hypothetical protein
MQLRRKQDLRQIAEKDLDFLFLIMTPAGRSVKHFSRPSWRSEHGYQLKEKDKQRHAQVK